MPKIFPSSSRAKIALLSAAALGIGALTMVSFGASRSPAPPAASKPAAMKLASIPVEGMFCLSCAATIKQKVKSLPGVVDAEVHFADKVVVVNYDASRTDVPVRAAAAINALGYKAGTPTVAG